MKAYRVFIMINITGEAGFTRNGRALGPPWHRETKVAKGAPRMIPLLRQYYSKTTAATTGDTSNNGVGTDTKLY